MIAILHASFTRQIKGLRLLSMLLEHEHALLRAGEPDKVTGLELATQELIRQLVHEREFVRRILARAGLHRLQEFQPEGQEEGDFWASLIEDVREEEQNAARLASRNTELATALWQQSERLVQEFQHKTTPREQTVYTARGVWQERPTTAALVQGRL